MMKNSRHLSLKHAAIIPAAAFLVVLGGLTLVAAGGPHGHPGPMGHEGDHSGPGLLASHLERIVGHMSLTPSEKTAVDALFAAHKKTAAGWQEQMAAAHKAVAFKVLDENFDEAGIRASATAATALMAEGIVADAALLRDVRAVLGVAEREQLNQTLEKHAAMIGVSGDDGSEGPGERHEFRLHHGN